MWRSEIEKGPLANVSPKAASGSALGGFRGFHTPCSYLVPTVRNRQFGAQHRAITLFPYSADNTRETKIMWLARY
jgi:hypothetical protein